MQTRSLMMDASALEAAPVAITFDSRGGRMIGLGFINGILKLLTLGLYSFWGKTEVRRRIWSATRLSGEPLAYTGTGKELFLGFLIVFGLVVLPAMLGGVAVSLLFTGSKQALGIYQAALYLAFFLLVGNPMYRAQRYRLSRTEWRGIRGAMTGSPGRYGWTYFCTLAGPIGGIAGIALLSAWITGPAVGGVIMVLGLIATMWVLPWRANLLQGMLTNDMQFGDRPMTYNGTPGPLYKRYLFAWLGNSSLFAAALAGTAAYILQGDRYSEWFVLKVPPQLADLLPLAAIWLATLIASAVITSWYRASQMNHFARNTHFEGATFRGEATGRRLMWLVLSNWLLSILGLVAGIVTGGLLIYAFGPASSSVPAAANTAATSAAGLIAVLCVVPPLIVMTTLTATFAQFRSARYFLSRLKLDGPVHLSNILQSANKVPARGEGLAQVFDIDAF